MKTVLVTGAGGLLGRSLVSILARDHRVVALAREPLRFEEPSVEVLAVDLSKPLQGSQLPARLDSVIYLAQSSRFRDFPTGAADIRLVNTDQPLALAELARERGASAFVYASTGSVYPSGPNAIREEDPVAPSGFYAASKLAAELLLRPYAAFMNVALLRYFFIYGRGQKRDMLLPRLIDSVRDGRPVTLQGEEGIRINPVHVVDAAQATAAALSLEGCQAVNIAGPEALSIRRICDIAGARLGRKPIFQVQPGRPDADLVADVSRMRTGLCPPRTRFEDGVGDLLESRS